MADHRSKPLKGRNVITPKSPVRSKRHKTPEQLWRMEEDKKTVTKKKDVQRTGSQFMIGKQWVFIKDGLDDFRDGLPPSSDSDIIVNPNRGMGPNVQGESSAPGKWVYTVKQPAVHKRYSKEEMCYTKLTPMQRQRRTHIQEIEYGLLQHPLALYPHLDECLPSELFEDVVDILDPEMNLVTEDEDDYDDEEEVEPWEGYDVRGLPVLDVTGDDANGQVLGDEEHRVRNPYRWLAWKEERERKDRKRMGERRVQSPSQDEHIKSVTKDFCDWVASLGGEANNIEESTITSLFASGYETKPALSVPIHVVELTNVPPELRLSTRIQAETPGLGKGVPGETPDDAAKWSYSSGYVPSWAKFRYGAWYLPTKLWKRRNVMEPLQDPKQLKKEEKSRAMKKSQNLDNELATMHGANAFMEFIDKKNVRRPEFLQHVSEIKEEHEREEEAKAEAELAKLKKLLTPVVGPVPAMAPIVPEIVSI